MEASAANNAIRRVQPWQELVIRQPTGVMRKFSACAAEQATLEILRPANLPQTDRMQ